ncbi:class I SAM-dependent methyltransferase [Gallaecimonas xiamenensis]|nr:methyltransferase [Gallaecimonas xiamenensis]
MSPKAWMLGAILALSGPVLADPLTDAVNSDSRPAEQKARDSYRHPQQTLHFFGISPSMTVVELWPGASGWYSAILAPYLKDKGHFIAANFSTQPGPGGEESYYVRAGKAFQALAAQNQTSWGQVSMAVLSPPEQLQLAPAGSVDAVLTFRNLHNWHKAGQLDQVFGAAFSALKPGGIFGVVEHRAKAGTSEADMASSGYMDQAYVVAKAEAAGFKLAASSEVNANIRDTKDHPRGVWTLPPTLALKEQDKAKYQAIGESDRMTLKFVKP